MRKKIICMIGILLIGAQIAGCSKENKDNKDNMKVTGNERTTSNVTITSALGGTTKDVQTENSAISNGDNYSNSEYASDESTKEPSYLEPTESPDEDLTPVMAEDQNQTPPTANIKEVEAEAMPEPVDTQPEEQPKPAEPQPVAPDTDFKDEIGSNKDAADGGSCPYALYTITTRVYYDTKGASREMIGFYQEGFGAGGKEGIELRNRLLAQYGLTNKDSGKKYNSWGLPIGTYDDKGQVYFVFFDIF